jgi:hypothetical protein
VTLILPRVYSQEIISLCGINLQERKGRVDRSSAKDRKGEDAPVE